MERAAPGSPIWPCTRWGFPCPADHSAGGRLLPYLFTLTAWLAPGGGLFSVALSVGTPRGVTSRVYPPPGEGYAASRPMVFGLSSPGLRQERSSTLPRPGPAYGGTGAEASRVAGGAAVLPMNSSPNHPSAAMNGNSSSALPRVPRALGLLTLALSPPAG